jgi:N6-adenosine-specific RNA methylase IME4
MSLTELSCLVVGEWPVQDIGADDSALFLWTTAPMFNTALQLMGAWEYDYKTVAFTWVKPTAGGHWAWGMGNHTRANAEFCLLGMRGRLRRVSASVHSLVVAMRREHSRKPDEVRDRITKLYGDVPRIELFARGQAADGWDCHGDEVLR